MKPIRLTLAALAVLVWAQDKARSKESFTNSLQMKLVLIPAGKFTMGSPESEKGRSASEKQHEVLIKEPFFLGVHEVRVRDFRTFVEDDGYNTEAEKAGDQNTWKNPGITQTEDHPVVKVSWNDAVASAVNHPLDRLRVVVGVIVNSSLRTMPSIADPSGLRATGTVMVMRLLPGATSGCQPNQIMV